MGRQSAPEECRRFVKGVEDKVEFVVGNVLDKEGVRRLAEERQVQRFVHAAAITPSGDVERNRPQHVINVNLLGTVNMLEVARDLSAKRFVFTSSSGVYGAPRSRTERVGEDSPFTLDKLYTICKYTCELLLRRYKSLFGLSTVAGRMTAIYGPMERPTRSRGAPSVIYALVSASLTGRTVRARGREFVRDYTRVEDACSIWTHLTMASELKYDLYNVSAGVAYSLDEVLKTLQEVNPGFRYSYAAPDEEADIEISPEGERGALNMTRARIEFGFSPAYDLKRGLETYLHWARRHPSLFPSADKPS
jgi:UDP-glucose 4-epimerase